MSDKDKQKWNQKYAEGAYESKTYPAAYLSEQIDFILAELKAAQIDKPWRALDLACGAGRNAHFLANKSFHVDALDISEVGLARAAENTPKAGSPINWLCRDLETDDLSDLRHYHLIIMMRYVNLPLLEYAAHRLLPSGFIVCEEHLQSEESVVGPRNPAFRVAPGALNQALSMLTICHHSESIIDEPNGERAAVSRIIAQQKSS